MRPRANVTERVAGVQHWLERQTDSKLGRLALRWFRAYFEASQNSGSAASLYSILSIVPFVLAVVGLFHAAGSDTNAFAQRLIDHLHLTGTTANLVSETFGSASSNALAATLAAAVSFLLWGIGIGQIYQDVYARAWGITVRSLADQLRFTIFFFVLGGLLGLGIASSEHFRDTGWAVLIPAWIIGGTAFWLWTPWLLLRGAIGLRALLPGALLAALVLGGANATSPLFLGGWMNSDGKYFGSFGVVLALIGWWFVLITISMVCAVFSPVWAAWRESERG
jgi:uncharacterized BrkB/YihY/UPF0761 family membrane protein